MKQLWFSHQTTLFIKTICLSDEIMRSDRVLPSRCIFISIQKWFLLFLWLSLTPISMNRQSKRGTNILLIGLVNQILLVIKSDSLVNQPSRLDDPWATCNTDSKNIIFAMKRVYVKKEFCFPMNTAGGDTKKRTFRSSLWLSVWE